MSAVCIAHRAAAAGNHAVCRTRAVDDAPDFMGCGCRKRRAGHTAFYVGGVPGNRLHRRYHTVERHAAILTSGADADDVAHLQRILGADNGSFAGRFGGDGNVLFIQVGHTHHFSLRVPRAVGNNHQVHQQLRVRTGADAILVTPQPRGVQILLDCFAHTGDRPRHAVQLAVLPDTAGERPHIAALLYAAVRVQKLFRHAVAGHQCVADARVNVDGTSNVE